MIEPQPDPLTDPTAGTPVGASSSASPQSLTDPTAGAPLDQPDASGRIRVSVSEPNTLGNFLSHAWEKINPTAAGQILPFPKQWGGAGLDAPLQFVKHVGAAQGQPYDRAVEAYRKGDKSSAAVHLLNYLIPIIGPMLDTAGEHFKKGEYAAGAGDSVGIALSMFGPKALAENMPTSVKVGPVLQNPNPAERAAVAFGQERGVPVDVATASGNPWARRVQAMTDSSPIGSVVAMRAKTAEGAALSSVGEELANRVRASAAVPETAGQAINDALKSKIEAHHAAASQAYGTLRTMEADPAYAMKVPIQGPKTEVSGVPGPVVGQLRRIVHELDAKGFDAGKLVRDEAGGDYYSKGSGGASVFTDISANLPAGYTRGVVQNQIEAFLGGGPRTKVVEAAIDVAERRYMGRDRTLSTPELPASAMEVPTRLETSAGASGFQDMGFPVDLTEAKTALRPLYDRLMKQYTVAQRDRSEGLRALENIVNGPDWAPLSEADAGLSAIKRIARGADLPELRDVNQGVAAVAVRKLDAAVTKAASMGGESATQALETGRGATKAKYKTSELYDRIRAEPVQAYRQMVAPGDAGIELLRSVAEQVPQVVPQIARAKLQSILDLASDETGGFTRGAGMAADWNKLGKSTKKILFPEAGQVEEIGHFMLLAKKLAENPNPSGTAITRNAMGQMALAYYDPVAAGGAVLGSGAISALLRSRAGVNLLTRGISYSIKAEKVAAGLEFSRAAALAGQLERVGAAVPKAAADQTSPAE